MAAKRTRRDPKRRRRAPHEVGRFGLLNPDPNYKYCWVNVNDQATGVPKYLADGWEPVIAEKDGVMPRVGRTVHMGQEIVNSGMLLMRLPAEEAEEIFRYGEDGESGQVLADLFQEKMFQRESGNVDRFRGVKGNRIGEFSVVQDARDSLA